MIVTCSEDHSRFLREVLFGTDTRWFESFKAALADEGIHIIGVTVCPASESHFVQSVGDKRVRIPVLSLYALGENAERLMRVKRDISGILDPSYKEQVLDIWRRVCIDNGVDTEQYCGIGAYVSVGRVEGIICNNVIRSSECISAVEKAVVSLCGKRPRNVYCSSLPSYNIVFTAEDYISAGIDSKKDILSEKIRSIILPHFREICTYDVDMPLSVSFWHPEMPNYNGYGLARQD